MVGGRCGFHTADPDGRPRTRGLGRRPERRRGERRPGHGGAVHRRFRRLENDAGGRAILTPERLRLGPGRVEEIPTPVPRPNPLTGPGAGELMDGSPARQTLAW